MTPLVLRLRITHTRVHLLKACENAGAVNHPTSGDQRSRRKPGPLMESEGVLGSDESKDGKNICDPYKRIEHFKRIEHSMFF